MDYIYVLSNSAKYKNCKYEMKGNDYSGLNWLDQVVVKPTQAELEAEYVVCKAANEYKEKRRLEYPAIEDQLDMIYNLGFDGWKLEIKKVKDKYPKPA